MSCNFVLWTFALEVVSEYKVTVIVTVYLVSLPDPPVPWAKCLLFRGLLNPFEAKKLTIKEVSFLQEEACKNVGLFLEKKEKERNCF